MDAAVIDLGQVRGLALVRAKGARIRHVAADICSVPSASGSGGCVVGVSETPALVLPTRKAALAASTCGPSRYHRHAVAIPVGENIMSEAVRPPIRKTGALQRRAVRGEGDRAGAPARTLRRDPEAPQPGRGRPRIPLKDAVYCVTMKVYGTMSGRRATTDLRTCEEQGHVRSCARLQLDFPLRRAGRSAAALADARRGVREAVRRRSSEPSRRTRLASRRRHTSDGSTTRTARIEACSAGSSCHAMIGTITNVITAVDVTEGHVNDSPMFEGLLERTAANGFEMREVSADKAYLSHANLAAVESVGAMPYVPFKSNSGNAGSAAWERLYHLYSLNREAFLSHYHKRSNVESTFSAIKRKFGAGVRSKLPAAQFNEVLLKCLCFNLSMLVHSILELGIEPKFWMPKEVSK